MLRSRPELRRPLEQALTGEQTQGGYALRCEADDHVPDVDPFDPRGTDRVIFGIVVRLPATRDWTPPQRIGTLWLLSAAMGLG